MTSRALLVLLATSGCVDATFGETESSIDGASTVVALTFDDTFADNYQVGDMALARGMRVVFYVNSSRIGNSGSMTRSQLLSLQQDGHEIGGHTISHANLTQLAEPDARGQVCNDRVALLDAGFDVRTFAYPFGANNATVDRIVEECGYNSARDVGGLTAPGSCSGCPYANPLPPTLPYNLRTQSSVVSSTTLAQMQGYVTQAEQNGGGFVPIVFHHVCDNCGSQAVSPATLAAFMDWLEARGPETQVGTLQDVIGGPLEPGVRADPPPTDPPPASNLIRNPSLETDADRNAVPDCWQRGGTGTNSYSYALTNDAYDGSVAQRITISSWTSGGRRLVTAQDLGSCAAPVTAGRSYTMTAYYKATTQPRFSVYYRTASGAWVWFAQSPALPTSSTYRQATYTTPPLPSEAVAISLGLTIFNVGTITMDAYQLVDASGTPPPSDTTAPTLTTSCNGAACNSTTYTSPVSVALNATDSGSGVREIRYTTNGSDPTNGTLYTGPFSVSSTSTVRATAVDNAGNRTSQSTTITIGSAPPTDTTPPTLSTSCNGAACSSTAYANPVSVSFTASDSGSGVREIRYTTNGSDPTNGTLYTAPFTVSSTSTVRVTAVDNAGNRTSQSTTITIGSTPPPADTTPPTLAIACNGSACSSTAYSAPVTVSLTSSDTGSGVREVRYTTNGSDPTNGTLYTGPFTISSTSTVRATAVDNANNRTNQTATVTIGSTPPPPVGNLLLNASLETDADGNGIADCWRQGNYGTNTGSFTRVADAFDGSFAARVQITSWSSGGRRVLNVQDAGACAPAITAGRRYTVSAYYKSTIAPRFTIYYRNSSGAWVWHSESASLPTSTTYRQATFTTPVLPAGATHISVALSIFNVGTLTADAFTLVEAP